MAEATVERAQKRPLLQDWKFILGLLAAGVIAAAALAGVMLAVRTAGDRQVSFISHERVFGDPGGRVFFYTDRGGALIKTWSLPNLPPDKTYELWAVEGGMARSLALAQSSAILEIDLYLHTDLTKASQVVVTVEPARGSAVPSSAPVLTMLR